MNTSANPSSKVATEAAIRAIIEAGRNCGGYHDALTRSMSVEEKAEKNRALAAYEAMFGWEHAEHVALMEDERRLWREYDDVSYGSGMKRELLRRVDAACAATDAWREAHDEPRTQLMSSPRHICISPFHREEE